MEADGPRKGLSGRRSRIVCSRCHQKKIRCDLQRVDGTCSACLSANASCEFRPSHKGHHRKRAVRESRQAQNEITILRPAKQHGNGRDVVKQPEDQLPQIASNGGNYVRALLGHQSELHAAETYSNGSNLSVIQAGDTFVPGTMKIYLETYSEVCYTWCPIVDVDDSTVTTDSLLLDHSLAAVASMIRPTLMPGASSSREHYERARHHFYSGQQHNTLTLVKAALLLSCCNNCNLRSPTDGTFWWLGVAIRLAQDMRLHRAPRNPVSMNDMGVRRRIWWTLFARERVMALCQGRPCVIDESECSLGLPQEADFPENNSREASIFIQWTSLSRITGKVNSHMSIARQTGVRIPTQEIAISLTTWLQSLSSDLQLRIQAEHTAPFVRDIHILHLPYLTTIALVYLNTTGQDAPEVSTAAVVAASCITRIIGDMLLRGCVHTLPEDAGWYITIAVTALMHVRPLTSLSTHAAADIRTLRTALGHLGAIWSSAKILAAGLDKILDQTTLTLNHVEGANSSAAKKPATLFTAGAQNLQDLCSGDGVVWAEFFPFATAQTSPLVGALLAECQDSLPELWPAFEFGENFDTLWDDFLASQSDLPQDVW